jgi:hypothetical protein
MHAWTKTGDGTTVSAASIHKSDADGPEVEVRGICVSGVRGTDRSMSKGHTAAGSTRVE